MDFNCIEEFAKNYKYTISAFTTAGTWMAVVIALYISNKTTKPKLMTSAEIGYVFYEGRQDKEAISATISNIGHVSVNINYFSFYLKIKYFKSGKSIINPAHYPDVDKSKTIRIEPGESQTLVLIENLEEYKNGLNKLYKTSNLPKIFWKLLKGITYMNLETSDGRVYKVKLGKGYKTKFQ